MRWCVSLGLPVETSKWVCKQFCLLLWKVSTQTHVYPFYIVLMRPFNSSFVNWLAADMFLSWLLRDVLHTLMPEHSQSLQTEQPWKAIFPEVQCEDEPMCYTALCALDTLTLGSQDKCSTPTGSKARCLWWGTRVDEVMCLWYGTNLK